MLKKLIYYILIFNFTVVSAQLNQEPKKITKKFFSEHNDIENITPALKKKKGFTNYQELLSYIDEKVQKYPELVSSNFIGESQKGKKIPIVFIKKIRTILIKSLGFGCRAGCTAMSQRVQNLYYT